MRKEPIRLHRNWSQEVVARYLLDIQALKFWDGKEPFKWSSGLNTPIYCDNRKSLSHRMLRGLLVFSFLEIIKSWKEREFDVIAGVATGAIAIGALVAEELQLPYCYVKKNPKGHGTRQQIEGDHEILARCRNILVVEDLISTGQSSLNAVSALREAFGDDKVGCMAAIFSYQLPQAFEAFEEAGVEARVILDYPFLIDFAVEKEYVDPAMRSVLEEWYQDPQRWSEKYKPKNDRL